MPRYIDAIELVKAIEENQRNTEHHKDGRAKQIHVHEHRHFIKMVHEQPTAVVVPRAEVAREIFEEIEDYIDRKLALLIGVIEDGEVMLAFKALLVVQDYLVELKKKYTEGKT